MDWVNTIDWKKLGMNVILGYAVSWLYFMIALYALEGIVGKIKAAFLAYATSWPVWLGVSTLLQRFNPKDQ